MKFDTDKFVKISPQQPRRKENIHNANQPQYLQNMRPIRSPKQQYNHQQQSAQTESFQNQLINSSSFTPSTLLNVLPTYLNNSSSSSFSNSFNKNYYVGSYLGPSLVSSQKKANEFNPVKISLEKLTPDQINSQSPTRCYAGAKFWDAPSPSVLPLPPAHWIPQTQPGHDPYNHIATHLKAILQVA